MQSSGKPYLDKEWMAGIRHYDGSESRLVISAPTAYHALTNINRHFGVRYDYEVTSLQQTKS